MPGIVTFGLPSGSSGGTSPFSGASVSVSNNIITLTLGDGMDIVELDGFANKIANWTISTSSDYPVSVLSVSSGTGIVTIHTTEQTIGGSYIINIPNTGIFRQSDGFQYSGPYTASFTGASINPSVVSATEINVRSVIVQFNQIVKELEASNAANYTFTNGINAISVSKINELQYLITTSLMTPGRSYTLTVNNVHDLAGNLVA